MQFSICRLSPDGAGPGNIVWADQVAPRFRNYYYCVDCDCEWHACWSSTCNDRCPQCNVEIEPFSSEDV